MILKNIRLWYFLSSCLQKTARHFVSFLTDATVLPDKTVALLTELLVVYEIIDFMKTSGSGRGGDGDRP